QHIDFNCIDCDRLFHSQGESRCRADSTLAVAHYGVTTPWNRTTIPRRCALCCTIASALSTLPN
ncbi:MAG: hypothetical protein RPU15_00905, partial [Candidatus Sedimenticola sp. (ex Thyasira tokunagai)]